MRGGCLVCLVLTACLALPFVVYGASVKNVKGVIVSKLERLVFRVGPSSFFLLSRLAGSRLCDDMFVCYPPQHSLSTPKLCVPSPLLLFISDPLMLAKRLFVPSSPL